MRTFVINAGTAVCGALLSISVLAQTAPTFYPVDLYACTLNEGVTLKDAGEMDKKFAKWAMENDPAQTSWRLLPQWLEASTDMKFDVGYIGTWMSGEKMGAGMKAWTTPGNDVAMEYGEMMSCVHSIGASTPINVPEDYEPGSGLLWFSRCTLSDGATMSDALMAHKEYSETMAGSGSGSASWMLLPGLGFGDMEFDYYQVSGFRGYEELGAGFDSFYNGGGVQMMMQMSETTECASPNLYHADLVVTASE